MRAKHDFLLQNDGGGCRSAREKLGIADDERCKTQMGLLTFQWSGFW
jgi:hypothetical protein